MWHVPRFFNRDRPRTRPGEDVYISPMTTRKKRRELILELVSRNEIENQEQLQALLEVEGVHTTQATISRDLRDLSISKTQHGYAVVELEEVARVDLKDLAQTIRTNVNSIKRAGTLVVICADSGHGNSLGLKIDQANLPQVVGTIASERTVFIATQSASQATEVCRILRDIAR